MLQSDGWKLKKYKNCGVEYFAWHKDGFFIREEDIDEDNGFWKWEDAI